MKNNRSTVGSILTSSLLIGGLLLGGCSSSKEAAEAEKGDERSIGYGTQSKEMSTSAVSTIDADADQRPLAHVEQMLEGTSGVRVVRTPGGGFKVQIRGASSFHGSTEPLYVIDGVPIELERGEGLDWLNPRDVSTISVLKDASATAIYGSRGAHGVVIIDTKRQ